MWWLLLVFVLVLMFELVSCPLPLPMPLAISFFFQARSATCVSTQARTSVAPLPLHCWSAHCQFEERGVASLQPLRIDLTCPVQPTVFLRKPVLLSFLLKIGPAVIDDQDLVISVGSAAFGISVSMTSLLSTQRSIVMLRGPSVMMVTSRRCGSTSLPLASRTPPDEFRLWLGALVPGHLLKSVPPAKLQMDWQRGECHTIRG